MTKKVKDNLIYRHCYKNIYERDLNAMFVIVGRPGRGKSTLALKMCQDMDPTFNTNRVCYSIAEVAALMSRTGDPKTGRLKPGEAVLLDEIVNEAGSYSRTALSKHNQVMNFIVANLRARRIILIMCLPKFTQLDKDVREVGLTGTFQMLFIDRKRKKSKVKFKWREPNEMTGSVIDPFPRVVDRQRNKLLKVKAMWFGKPSFDLELAYKKKKEEYMIEKVDKWLDMLTDDKGAAKKTHARDIAKEILANPKKFQSNGKFDYLKILANYDVGDQKARNIGKTAHLMLENT